MSEAAARDRASTRKKGRKNEFTKTIRPVNRAGERGSSLVHYYNTTLIHKLNTETACFVDAMGLLLFLNVLRIHILITFHISAVSLYSIQFLLAISKSITGG